MHSPNLIPSLKLITQEHKHNTRTQAQEGAKVKKVTGLRQERIDFQVIQFPVYRPVGLMKP